MKASLLKKLDILHDRFEELTALLGDAEVISDQNRFRAYSKEYAEVEPVIAALDAVFGAVRATLDGIFDDKVFVVSFLSNVVVAAFIVFLGDQLGVGSQLSTGVVVVLGVRIFSNVASIRRHLFNA